VAASLAILVSGLSHYLRRIWRNSLTAESLLTVAEAVEAIPGRSEVAKAWLGDSVAARGAIGGEPFYRWGDVLEALASKPCSLVKAREEAPEGGAGTGGPLKSWRAVAAAIGVSEDTVGRHRKRKSDVTPCYFESVETARAWWRDLLAPQPRRRRSERRAARGNGGGALDVAALVKVLGER
jgi:hypothetical protein